MPAVDTDVTACMMSLVTLSMARVRLDVPTAGLDLAARLVCSCHIAVGLQSGYKNLVTITKYSSICSWYGF